MKKEIIEKLSLKETNLICEDSFVGDKKIYLFGDVYVADAKLVDKDDTYAGMLVFFHGRMAHIHIRAIYN